MLKTIQDGANVKKIDSCGIFQERAGPLERTKTWLSPYIILYKIQWILFTDP